MRFQEYFTWGVGLALVLIGAALLGAHNLLQQSGPDERAAEPAPLDPSLIGEVSGGWQPTPSVFPLWKGENGESYAISHHGGAYGGGTLFRISPDGHAKALHDFSSDKPAPAPPRRHHSETSSPAEWQRLVLEALPVRSPSSSRIELAQQQ